MKKIMIIGGDRRQIFLRDFLRKKGLECFHVYGRQDLPEMKNAGGYDAVVLPVPMTKNGRSIYRDGDEITIGLEETLGVLLPDQQLFAGSVSESTVTELAAKNISVFDIMQDEAFLTKNAFLTAQGALSLLLGSIDGSLFGKRALVTGFGRVGKAVALTLKNNGLFTDVAARSPEQLALASCLGYGTQHIIDINEQIGQYDYLFGTVPFGVITDEGVKNMKSDAIYFELASAPFGARREDFLRYRKNYSLGSSLPGRFFPRSAGEIIGEYILEKMQPKQEKGVS